MGFARYPLCAPDPWAVSSSQPMAPMSIIHLLLTPVLPSKGAKPTFPKHVSEHKQASHNKALQTIGIYILQNSLESTVCLCLLDTIFHVLAVNNLEW